MSAKLNTHLHLEQSLQRDIDHIRAKVAEMAGLSQGALKASVRALTERNRQLAYSVILRDQFIDELETLLDRLCLEFIARHQPVAGHLRFIFAAIHINRELERIGDYAESIARQVLAVSGLESPPPHDQIVALYELASGMLAQSVQSFLSGDADLAVRTMKVEEQANSLRDQINARLRELSDAGAIPAFSVTPFMNVARRLERTADQAKNLCEEVLYMCTGQFIRHQGADGFRVLFFDAGSNCLGQMAEALGKAMNLPRFTFLSAGLIPQPVDPRLAEFLRTKGLELPASKARVLAEVPGWEHCQVIVGLGAKAREAMPQPAGKAICFQWPVADPVDAGGSLDQAQPAFESAFEAIRSHLRELVDAIAQEPNPIP